MIKLSISLRKFVAYLQVKRKQRLIMKALILAAGLGTRLKPFTDTHPKALAPVNSRSLLEINIRNLQRFGIFDVVINVHHFADQIIEVLERNNGFGSRFQISDETDAVLETGGGLKKAGHFFRNEQSFLIINVDILSNFDMNKLLTQHNISNSLATLAVQERTSSRYFLFGKPGHPHPNDEPESLSLYGWKNINSGEEKIPRKTDQVLKPLAFSGIQLLSSAILDKIKMEGKFSLVDVYLDLCTSEKITAWEHTGDLLLDVGKTESLQQAAELFPS